MSPLTLPGPRPLTPGDETALSEMVGRIYQFCRANRHAPIGQPYMTWDMDLRQRNFAVRASPDASPEKLLGWTYTPHMNARRQAIAAAFEFRFADRSESYFVGQEVSFKGLQLHLTGNEFERTFPPAAFEPVPESEWDVWGRGVTAEIGRRYEEVIYPRIVETLERIAGRLPGRTLCVADLGGGAGQLAALVCERLPQVGTMLLVDRSAALIRQAEPRAARYPGRLVTRVADLTAEGFFEGLEERPDVVILCGVVATQVMDHAQGLRLLQGCHRILPEGGFAIVPSYSPALLASREYEAMGFAVHNKTLNVIEDGPGGSSVKTNDFYIVEKQ